MCDNMQTSMTVWVQMSEKIAVKKLPSASVSLLGSGVMQWSKDKQIDVLQGTHHQAIALQPLQTRHDGICCVRCVSELCASWSLAC